jgi:mannose-6-phosphate isomerase-like protein (cupin superfamily)
MRLIEASSAGRVIVNPLSGERIVIRLQAAGDGVLAWELILDPGGAVPSRHAHPNQQESFTVLEGSMRFRVGRRGVDAGPGETVRVPPGAVHHFANLGGVPARVSVETRPALDMAAMLEVAAALAQDQQSAGRRLPRLLDLVLFMRDFRHEVAAPYLPAALVGGATRPLAWIARLTGADAHYRDVRGRGPAIADPGE